VGLNLQTRHWAIASPLVATTLRQAAPFTFLKEAYRDADGHRFLQVVGDGEADDFQGDKLTLEHLANDHLAWLGA